MKDDILEKLTAHTEKVLKFVEDAGNTGIDFAKEQVPLVIHEILAWGFYYNLTFMIVYLCLFLISITFFLRTRKKIWEWQEKNPDTAVVFLYGITGGPTITFFCLTISYFIIMLKVVITPRLYLIEQLQHLIYEN